MPLSTIFQLYCGSQFYIFEVILTTFREDIEVLDPILMRDNMVYIYFLGEITFSKWLSLHVLANCQYIVTNKSTS